MIAYLKGTLLQKSTEAIIVENGGIGYEVIVPLSTFYALPESDELVSLNIYTYVKEDAFTLFGFHTVLEKDAFLMLITVSGIGPKLAINILSGIGPEELIGAIALEDKDRLQSVPGIGRKTAERIALELKEKAQRTRDEMDLPFTQTKDDEEQQVQEDVLSALLNLGYPENRARRAVDNAMALAAHDIRLEVIIREALKLLA
jgi:Holliday junction DNA helicase RuvA